jgi:hypothetical protein
MTDGLLARRVATLPGIRPALALRLEEYVQCATVADLVGRAHELTRFRNVGAKSVAELFAAVLAAVAEEAPVRHEPSDALMVAASIETLAGAVRELAHKVDDLVELAEARVPGPGEGEP